MTLFSLFGISTTSQATWQKIKFDSVFHNQVKAKITSGFKMVEQKENGPGNVLD